MDWTFYLIVFVVLFCIVAALMSVRFLVNKRLERFEKKRRLEKEAQQISETNSGL